MMEIGSNDMSRRGWSNVAAIMPKISGAVAERTKANNTNIDLSTAENWLIRPELLQICKDAITSNLDASHFSYPRGFSGDPQLLEAFASFFNTYFHPHIPVETSHLATAPGASTCLDALLYNICDPGDGILVPGPYWNGFDFQFRARSSATPVVVNVSTLEATLTQALILALEIAYEDAPCPIKGLILTNPHNPLAQCYPKPVLEECLRFCQRHDIHFISDEIYALTSFPCPDLPNPKPFVSVLSLDVASLGCDLSRVHTFWSPSKDFGQSGFRMGCTISQSNKPLVVGLALASNTQTSSLTAIFVAKLLTSPLLPSLLAENSLRLSAAYSLLTSFLKQHSIPYIPSNAGLYLFAKIAPTAKSWGDEAKVVLQLREAGVLVSPGKAYHGPEMEKGWSRVGFGVRREDLQEAIRRMEGIFGEPKKEQVYRMTKSTTQIVT